ncbi:MAG: DUF6338 family protein [Sphingomonadaceae bacterium]
MEALLDTEKVQTFLFFAVPGIIALYVRAQFLTGRMPPIAEGIATYVTLSLIYHAITYPLASSFYTASCASALAWVGWIVLLFVAPAILGLLLGLNVRKGWSKRLLTKARLNTVHPINCAWDWRFSECEACWTLATLKDGTRWAGFMGQQSFISSDPGERDIYIQQVYEIGDDNSWTPRTSSVWIAHGEIQSLEFWPDKKEE